MIPSLEELKQELKNRNISMSFQRLKVLEYLTSNRCHPTVDRIYTDLHPEIPTLSKTTVYSTLKILVEAGLVNVVVTENETRYDIATKTHGHFKCESCGVIYDFDIDINAVESEDLNGFQINNKNLYFRGICKKCIDNYGKNK